LPQFLVVVTVVALIAAYYIKFDPLQALASEFNTWAVLFAGWLSALAVVSTTVSNVKKIQKNEKGWPYAIVLLAALYITILLGAVLGPGHSTFSWIFNSIARATYGAMQATTAFFIITAAYRAFRARTVDTTILLIVAVLVMLGNITLGTAIWTGFRPIRDWLYSVPMAHGNAAIYITMAIGAMALGIRTVLGVERGVRD
jgi:hypothetical protein